MFIDARVPVHLGPDAPTDAAVLVEDAPIPAGAAGARFELSSHALDCACCTPRSPVAQALAFLFAERARGNLPFFNSVRALGLSGPGRDAVLDALSNDPVASARFRLAS